MVEQIVFPDREPYWEFDRDCLSFPALVDGKRVKCLVTAELLMMDNVQSEIQTLAELRTKVAVLEERLNELKRGGEELGRKRWALLPPLIGASLAPY